MKNATYNSKYKRQGFVLINLLLSVLVMVLLAAVMTNYAPSFFEAGKKDKALADTATLGGLISQYEMEVGTYPTKLEDLTAKVGQYGPWIKSVPDDPFNPHTDYQYSFSDEGYVVFSIGANGTPESSVGTGISGDDLGFQGF